MATSLKVYAENHDWSWSFIIMDHDKKSFQIDNVDIEGCMSP